MAPYRWYLLLFAVLLQQQRCGSVEQQRRLPRFSFPSASVAASTMIDDEAEAALFRRVIGGSAELTKSSMRLLARGVRRAGDTFAGLVSGVIKASGGVFNLLADALSEVSTPLIRPRAPHDRMPHLLDHVGRRIGRGLRSGAKVLFFVGESCILAGETTEALTVGLGQSIEDSFLGLEFVAGVIQRGAQRVLQPPHRIKQPGGEYIWRRGGGLEKEEEEGEGEGEQRKNDSTAIGGRAGESPLHPPPPAVAASKPPPPAAKHRWDKDAEEAEENRREAAAATSFSSSPLISHFVNLAIAGAARLDEDDAVGLGIPFLYRSFASWVLEPFSFQSVAGLSPPSISIHVMGSAVFVAVMASLSYSLTRRRVLVLFCSCLLAWAYLMSVDTVLRKKIETRTSIRAVGSFVKGLVEESERAKRAGGAGVGNFFESSAWVNVLLSSLWTLDGYPYNNPRRGPWLSGGLGPYIGETWELLLNDQLALVPPGVANLQLTRFSLGTLAPVVQAVRFDSVRDAICLAAPGTGRGGGGGGGGAGGRAAACHHLVAYVDFKYLSQDMDIVFSLRSPDVKSVLPEATVKLSEISLSGVVRIDAELSSDYPFVGNASISFTRLPVLDCSISSFGGVDLASIPGVYTWINITMTWLLTQYTAPRFGVFDLRHTICPSCDDGKVTHAPWSAEAMKEAADALGNGLKGGWEQLRAAWRSIRARREQREVVAGSGSVGSISSISGSGSSSSENENEVEEDEVMMANPAAGRTKSTAEIARDLVTRTYWSNGSMALMVAAVLWLSFRLIRNKPVQIVSSVSP